MHRLVSEFRTIASGLRKIPGLVESCARIEGRIEKLSKPNGPPSAASPAGASAEFVPAGHFYSVVPSKEDIERSLAQPRGLPGGIDMRDKEQFELLERFVPFYRELPFSAEKQDGLLYAFENRMYSYTDGIFLYAMLRHLKPRRIIEVGSGFSSAVILDTKKLFLAPSTDITFIEPFTKSLRSVVPAPILDTVTVIEQPLQNVDVQLFRSLGENDILFIDSTHVVKTGSDLWYLFARVLPELAPGVVIHFHDIFHPFEMPADWLKAGRFWNENYFLAAFLQFNSAFRIELFATYLHERHPDWFAAHMPLCLKNKGGNIWLRRVGPR